MVWLVLALSLSLIYQVYLRGVYISAAVNELFFFSFFEIVFLDTDDEEVKCK